MKHIVLMIALLMGLTATAAEKPGLLGNNLKCVDLSDLIEPLPLDVVSTKQILKQTEDWEHSSYKNPQWPKSGHQSLGLSLIHI